MRFCGGRPRASAHSSRMPRDAGPRASIRPFDLPSGVRALRELGIIPEEQNARVLADFLLTLNIGTKVVTNRDGRFGVWVQNEDRLAEARRVYDEFVARLAQRAKDRRLGDPFDPQTEMGPQVDRAQ